MKHIIHMKISIYRLFLSFVVLSLLSGNAYGQLTPGAWSGAYMTVNSYNTSTFSGTYSLQIGYQNVNIKNWTLTFRANGPIRNNEGKIIPYEKVKIKINTISGVGAPTFSQLGIVTTPIPLSLASQAIIPRSNWAIQALEHQNKLILLTFDIIIEGGGYLQALKPGSPHGSRYLLNLIFSIKEGTKNWYESTPTPSEIVIDPQGTPPIDPVYSIQINNNASNGLLEFKSISDYVNGVSQTYGNGLTVISSTPYALQVKAQNSAFESPNNNSIPLSTVSLNLKAVNSSVAGTVQLSNVAKTIINSVVNSGTQPRNFDIRYFTSPSDTRLQNAKPDTYSTTLIYTLIPQ